MGPFKFRLTTLLKLRINERQQRQIELSQAREAERLLQNQVDGIADEIAMTRTRVRTASSPGSLPVDSLLEMQRYTLQLAAQAALIANRMGQIRAEVERRRQVVMEADRQVRMLEKLRDKQAAAYQMEAQQREQKMFDEIAQKKLEPTN